MTTKKKNSPSDRQRKADPFREPQRQEPPTSDMWKRLRDLGEAFHRAAVCDRSENLADMGLILRMLSHDPEFRKIAKTSLRSYLSKTSGVPMLARSLEGRFLLETVEAAIAGSGDPRKVAAVILLDLPLCSGPYSRTEGPLHTGDFLHPWGDDDDFRATKERVAEAIAPKLADPDDANPEKVLRAALRALGCDAKYVNNMFR